jgi:hypothetical protein
MKLLIEGACRQKLLLPSISNMLQICNMLENPLEWHLSVFQIHRDGLDFLNFEKLVNLR